jgi:hypothetical protein
MLSAPPRSEDSPFAAAIKEMFEKLIGAFASIAEEAGQSREAARSRAERAVVLLQGSLVLSRGLGSDAPFKAFLAGLTGDLIGSGA